MLPREHGAYGQMAFPLVTMLAVAGITVPALLLVISIVALFLAHEPMLVLLGLRGPRARREHRGRAARWLAATVGIALAAATAAFLAIDPRTRWAFGVPALPAALVAAAVVSGREKTTSGESMAAIAFSLATVPVGLAAGAPPSVAVAIAVVFAVTFLGQTLAVRSVILAVRAGGNRRAAETTRHFALAVTAAGVLGVAAAMRYGLPWSTLDAMIPGIAAVVWLVVAPPPPSRLRRVGWTLVSASVATSAILVMALR